MSHGHPDFTDHYRLFQVVSQKKICLVALKFTRLSKTLYNAIYHHLVHMYVLSSPCTPTVPIVSYVTFAHNLPTQLGKLFNRLTMHNYVPTRHPHKAITS